MFATENRLTIANVKVKSYVDEECKVIGYTEGHGKFENLLGALLCNLKSDKIIKIGSGFTNEERTYPPKIGAIITFKCYGLTSKGNKLNALHRQL